MAEIEKIVTDKNDVSVDYSVEGRQKNLNFDSKDVVIFENYQNKDVRTFLREWTLSSPSKYTDKDITLQKVIVRPSTKFQKSDFRVSVNQERFYGRQKFLYATIENKKTGEKNTDWFRPSQLKTGNSINYLFRWKSDSISQNLCKPL